MEGSLITLWSETGVFVRSVGVVLAAMSAYSLSVAMVKLWHLRRSGHETRVFAPEFARFLEEGQLDAAAELAMMGEVSHVTRVLGKGLAEVKPLLQDRLTVTSSDIDAVKRAAERETLVTVAQLRTGLNALATVGATAPLVGLLGATIGVAHSLQGMAAVGSGTLIATSAGIAEALLATALSLLVTIPAMWFHDYVQARIELFTLEIAYTSGELVDFLYKSIGAEFGRSIFTKEFKAAQTGGDAPITDRTVGRPRSPSHATVDLRPTQFTVFYPTHPPARHWSTLLAYVHLPSAVPDMMKHAKGRMRESGRMGMAESAIVSRIEAGASIRVIPQSETFEFSPREMSFSLIEDLHCAEFRMRQLPTTDGSVRFRRRIRVKFVVGYVLVGEAMIAYDDAIDASHDSTEEYAETTTEPYQAVFVSYAWEDGGIVDQLELAYHALGLDYLRDIRALRSGETWSTRVLAMIDRADVFQLCWSHAASRSDHVAEEWRHALMRGEPGFVRPVYWERPIPAVPDELAHLHFAFLPLTASVGPAETPQD